MKPKRLARWREGAVVRTVEGVARVDRRTKDLAKRLQPGEIAVIDHEDLDRVAAETLIDAGARAIVNASASITGRYPNSGPLLIVQAGIPILDGVGPELMDRVLDGHHLSIEGDKLVVDGEVVGVGVRQSEDSINEILEVARTTMGAELERFALNTLEYIRQEGHLLVDEPDLPVVPVDFKGRHVLIVVRGIDYKKDLGVLRQSGYLGEMGPLLVGVDGGADALLELGFKPDIIIGDMDSVSERALRCGAVLVVHGYRGGKAPGAERLQEMGLDHVVFESAGTSEDIAMLLAFERGASLIVAVGTHNSMVEFLDKGRAGMASTFLVRMKVGPILVDAKGVSRLYANRVRKRDLLLLVAAAAVTLILIFIVSEPVRVLLRVLLPFMRRPRAGPSSSGLPRSLCPVMINLRYHIVSITAVFLALGIGITMGSTFLGKATLDRIDNNVKNARTEVKNVKDENSALRNQVSTSQSRAADFLREALGREFNGDLEAVPVVVIAADGVDQDTLNNLRTALTASGAAFDGTLTVTTKFELNGGDAVRTWPS